MLAPALDPLDAGNLHRNRIVGTIKTVIDSNQYAGVQRQVQAYRETVSCARVRFMVIGLGVGLWQVQAPRQARPGHATPRHVACIEVIKFTGHGML